MVFEARLPKVSTLKKIVDAIKDLVKEANIECNLQGLSLQAMDGSHVALVSLMLRKEGFEDFTNHRNLTLGINLKNLDTFLKCAGKDDSVTLRAEDKADVLEITFESPSGDKCSTFTLKLMDIDQENLGIPETPYETTIRLGAGEFQRICRDLGQLGDTITISTARDEVTFSASGDIGGGTMTLRPNSNVERDEDLVEIEQSSPITLSFGVRYLRDFTKATSLSPLVILKMSPDSPLVVEYVIENLGRISFYVAPKIESEEGEME
ncbi:hypothetical protein RCL1_004220 [Eukaryota sp. TZLM3-RCL]